jgi:hypothetical protein
VIRVARLLTLFTALALIVGLAGAVTAKGRHSHAKGKPAVAKEAPSDLTPPASAVLLFELGARGVQIYTCAAKPEDSAAFVWTFKAPQAELFNARGEVVGSHFAGPTWQGQDGSAVVGKLVARRCPVQESDPLVPAGGEVACRRWRLLHDHPHPAARHQRRRRPQ